MQIIDRTATGQPREVVLTPNDEKVLAAFEILLAHGYSLSDALIALHILVRTADPALAAEVLTPAFCDWLV